MTKRGKEMVHGLIAAALLIGTALLTVSARKLGLVDDPSLGIRLYGILCGVILAAYGNMIPKRLVRFDPGSDGAARRQSCLRFCGWVFALAGLANAAIWAFFPLESAAFWSMVPILGALLLVGARIARPRGRAA